MRKLVEEVNNRYGDMKFFDIIKHHIENNIPINESPMRIDSDSFIEYVETIREIFEDGIYSPLNKDERFLLEDLRTGKKGVYQGKQVTLDTPFRLRGDKKAFAVYRANKKGDKDDKGRYKAVIIKWGDPDYKVKNDDKDASDSFWERHKCDTKKDQYTPGWWACHAPKRFGKLLKLAGGDSRW